MTLATALTGAVAAALGCAPSHDRLAADGGAHPDVRVEAGAPEEPPPPEFVDLPPCEPTLPSIQRNIFQLTCQWATCHGPPTPAYDLLLVRADVEQRLVGVPAASCKEWTLVVPGSPERSFLWQKVSTEDPPCGDRMPWRPERLTPAALECIRGWIAGLRPDASDASGTFDGSDAGDAAGRADAADVSAPEPDAAGPRPDGSDKLDR